MEKQIHGVSLATSAATASFVVAPLSSVTGPVSAASASGGFQQSTRLGLQCLGCDIHPSIQPWIFLTAPFLIQPNILPVKINEQGFPVQDFSFSLPTIVQTLLLDLKEGCWWIKWRLKGKGHVKHLVHTSDLALSLSPLMERWTCP